MKSKRASLVINPRAGQNLAKITDILAVLSAAGWQTELALKEYGGHTMTLATSAAEQNQDFVIAYGGDGTLNGVVNGVMHAKNQQSIIGLIPGGTANVWASEIGISDDPVNAALALINSDVHKVDVGHISIEGRTHSEASQDQHHHQPGKKSRQRQKKAATKVRQHFLLMAGLGIDAAIMAHVSQPLKYHVGALAVGVSTLKELPAHRPFPVEIRTGDANHPVVLWKGEALQVVIGNTRLYADIVEMTPDAYVDDGMLDVCVITAGNPLTTMQQIVSLLLRHHPDNLTAERFQGAQFSLSVPASVALQLDGSAVKLKEYLRKSDQQTLAHADESAQAMVTYRLAAIPHAVNMAVPRTYHGPLFAASAPAHHQQTEITPLKPETAEVTEQKGEQQTDQPSKPEPQENLEHLKALLEQGRVVTVVGVSPNPAEKEMYIVAGSVTKPLTGEVRPVAVRIGTHTLLRKRTGEDASLEAVSVLRAGDVIMVDGKKSKRGVIVARQVVI
ncbi:MAG TPA: diacylglycerol kinase family protein [Ktedonobacteraceae bacterium]|jgi:YegS/Rv2252/BmrU family lipid kinase|nr:diacylglycerol kinase family protein [Ktedonobacteraceae bacterium]